MKESSINYKLVNFILTYLGKFKKFGVWYTIISK